MLPVLLVFLPECSCPIKRDLLVYFIRVLIRAFYYEGLALFYQSKCVKVPWGGILPTSSFISLVGSHY